MTKSPRFLVVTYTPVHALDEASFRPTSESSGMDAYRLDVFGSEYTDFLKFFEPLGHHYPA
jgi:glutamate-1-semialdehyde aminotransferase